VHVRPPWPHLGALNRHRSTSVDLGGMMLDSGALRAEDDPAQKKEMFHIAITHGSVFATTSEPQHAHPDTISPKALPHRSLQTSLSKPCLV